MIEMLGVLAVIAVLSIGGLLGYRRAVNNHHANQILDDANRLAFVVMESGRAYEANAYIDNLEFTQTSIYNMDAFLGGSTEQFGLVVTYVPKGVCNALLPKAVVEYKVRVLPAEAADNVEQLSAYGALYDAQNTDICNDMNDVVLYFGDVSKQCTATGQEDCTSNADCCAGSFCWFQYKTCAEGECECTTGKCKLVSTYVYEGVETMSDGSSWVHGSTMTWQAGKNWCEAQGLKTVTREDIGCESVDTGHNCQSSKLDAIYNKWSDYGWHWLEPRNGGDRTYIVYPGTKLISYNVGPCGSRGFPFCH